MISAETFLILNLLPEAICLKTHLPEAICPKTLFPEVGKSLFEQVDSGEWAGTISPSSMAQKLTVQSRRSEQPSSMVDTVNGVAVNSAEGAGYHCRVPRCRYSL